jgi:hypothetical protein
MENLYLSHPEFYDKEYLKVKTKNEKLKIEKFWMDNNIIKFQGVLYILNKKTVNCNCNSCNSFNMKITTSKIVLLKPLNNNENNIMCLFKAILDKKCEENNITYGSDNNVHIKLIKENMWGKIKFGNLITDSKSKYDINIINYENFYNNLINYIQDLSRTV